MSLKDFKYLVGKNSCCVSGRAASEGGVLGSREAKAMLRQRLTSQYLNGTCRHFPLT